MTAALRLEDVTCRYGDVVAVDGVDLAVPRGSVRGLIGPNGAGKTTLFRAIAGDHLPDEGRVELGGRDVTDEPPHVRARAGLARVYQLDELFEALTVREHLRGALAADARGRGLLASAAEVEGVAEAAARVDIEGLLDATPSALSGGERRMLDVAMALATDPDVLLLDEPTAGLADEATARLRSVLASVAGDVTLVLVEHDVDLVMGLADTVTVLHEGRVIAEDAPDAVREDERVRRVYLGGEP